MNWKVFIPSVLWALVILLLSSLPGESLPEFRLDILSLDKLAHTGVYFILTSLIFYGLAKNRLLERKWILLAILISSGYGILMEIGQYLFFEGRHFEFNDIVANIIGSVGSLITIIFINKIIS